MKNPATAKEDLKQRILSYVNMALPIKDGMTDATWEKFRAFQQGDSDVDGLNIVKPPYLEVAKEYARSEYSLAQLARAEGGNLLHPDVASAFAKYLLDDDGADPECVFPYLHQYRALKAVQQEEKNLVVCTGTGSGKTESFLLPLIDAIYRAHVNAGVDYDSHIRAMILYPMNALVNDQISRLRRLLRYLPKITFGQFIGTTAHKGMGVDIDDALIGQVEGLDRMPLEEGELKLQPVECLPNEYRTRDQWKAPADILVTNYAMLERLLLVPESKCGFFTKCWDFIVIDEAHSYSGSVGTEIAWLMRRLAKRLKRNPVDADKKIHFLATSATLSEGGDWADKAKDFAAAIFPVDKDSVHAEAGDFAGPGHGGGHTLNVPLHSFFDANKQTYDKTIAYESEIASIKSAAADIDLMSAILEKGGAATCEQLYTLRNQFDLAMKSPIRMSEYQDLKMTPALAVLARLVLKKVNIMRNGKPGEAGELDNWRDFLHDVTKKAPSPIEGDTVKSNESYVQNRRGNRLDILKIWKQMAGAPEDAPKSIPYIVFHFMYIALLEMLHDVPELPDDLNRVMLEVTDTTKISFRSAIEVYAARKATAATMLDELDDAWRTALGVTDFDGHYPVMIYECIVDHEQSIKFRELSEGKPKSLDEYAAGLGCTPQEFLKVASIGALARTPSRRNAVIEVRYHQVVRDVSDVGVYFEGGNIDKPRFTRLDAETVTTGEKVFSLGICRDCGQPYLLGYSETRTFVSSTHLMRASTPSYKWLYAVAIGTPKPADGAAEEMQDPLVDVWLNLRTGKLSDTKTEGHEWTPAYWVATPAERQNHEDLPSPSFISKCPRCGTKQINKAVYGIVTPYEAVGEQYKIAVLDAFASLSEEDANARVRETATAEGRKVLAFSDSRSMAARLACDFEVVKKRRLADKITLDLASQGGVKVLTLDAKQALSDLKNQLDSPDADEEQISSQIIALKKDSTSWHITSNIDSLIDNGSPKTNRFKDVLDGLRYQQLLEWEGEDGSMADAKTAAEFLILKAVRDTARNGLRAQGLIDVRSAKIEGDSDWDGLVCPSLGITAERAKTICQLIYRHLVLRRKVILPSLFLKEGGERGDYLDVYERKGITRAGFRETKKNYAVYATCLLPVVLTALGHEDLSTAEKKTAKDWLNEVFTWFKEKWGILHSLENNGDEYGLEFQQLCGDLEILRTNPELGLTEVIPFSVEEHTAQIEGHVGALYQKAFAEGKVNILSCSTTFEMGIDVGGLNNVFLGNLPPASSNYRQRAGRAGRRPGAAAYILSLAGRSAHDRNYFSDVPSLFWGKIDPPRIYLEKPVFAARHFRAEALHDFLEYVVAHKDQLPGDYKNWEKASCFILGWHVYRQMEGKKVKEFNPVANSDYCTLLGSQWLSERESSVASYIASIKDYSRFRAGLGEAIADEYYSPAKDLLFQLLGSVPVINSKQAFHFYQDMGGCRLPEFKNGNTADSVNLKRMALRERLYRQLYMRRDRDDVLPYEASWPAVATKAAGYRLKIAQVRLLQERTIEILSESCVLPRYGFPVDEIELMLDRNELFGDVELRRPLQLGLFEYAPGQIVVANKRLYESASAAFLRYPKDDAPKESLAARLSSEASFCTKCHKIFENKQAENCPLCGQPLEKNCQFITPDVFYAYRSVNGNINKVPKPKGRRIVRWGGELISKSKVGGTSISTAESSDRMMQYINTNAGDEGFKVHLRQRPGDEGSITGRYYYVHEIQTNIAVWYTEGCKLPFANQVAPVEGVSRFDNACLSASYALRRSCAHELDVSVQDLGVIYMRIDTDPNGPQARFVFYDTAAGGGGNALALTMADSEDKKTEVLICKIIKGAIKALENDDNPLCAPTYPADTGLMPLPINIYRTKLENGTADDYRPAVSCYKCLKDFDNQDVHSSLDKYDAIEILKALLDPEPTSLDESEWVTFDPIHEHLKPMKWYKKTDGTVIQYNPLVVQLNKADIAFRKVCHD